MKNITTVIAIFLFFSINDGLFCQGKSCADQYLMTDFFDYASQVDNAYYRFTIPRVFDNTKNLNLLFSEPSFLQRNNLWDSDKRSDYYEKILIEMITYEYYEPAKIREVQKAILDDLPPILKNTKFYDYLSNYIDATINKNISYNTTLSTINSLWEYPADAGDICGLVHEVLTTPIPIDKVTRIDDFFKGTPYAVYAQPSVWKETIQKGLGKFSAVTGVISDGLKLLNLSQSFKNIIANSLITMVLANEESKNRLSRLENSLKGTQLFQDPAFSDALQRVKKFLEFTNSKQYFQAFMDEFKEKEAELLSSTIGKILGSKALAGKISSWYLATFPAKTAASASFVFTGWVIGAWALKEEFELIIGISEQYKDAELAITASTMAKYLCEASNEGNNELDFMSTLAYLSGMVHTIRAFEWSPLPLWNVFTNWDDIVEFHKGEKSYVLSKLNAIYSGYLSRPNGEPNAYILEPKEFSTVTGSIKVSAFVSDFEGDVNKTEFYINDQFAGTDQTAPYEFIWDTHNSPTGLNTLKIKVFDNAGNIVEKSAQVYVTNMVSLYSGSVTPTTGKASDKFVFSVFYKSSSGKMPDNGRIYVNVDGNNLPMTYDPNPDWSNGVKFTSGGNSFTAGQHNFYFSAVFNGQELKFPESGTLPFSASQADSGWDMEILQMYLRPSTVNVNSTFNLRTEIKNKSINSGFVYNNVPYSTELIDSKGRLLSKKTGIISRLAPSDTVEINTTFTSSGNDEICRVVFNIFPQADENIENNTNSIPLFVGNFPKTKLWTFENKDSNKEMYPGDSYSFNGSVWIQSSSTSTYANLRRDGGSAIKMYPDDFHTFDGDKTIIICTAIRDRTDYACYHFGTLSNEYISFDETTICAFAGDIIDFCARCPNDVFSTSNPDIFRNPEVDNWYSHLTFGDNAHHVTNFRFYIPQNAAPGEYPFFLGTKLVNKFMFVRELKIVIKQPLPVIDSISTRLFSADDIISIYGKYFTSAGTISFNGTKTSNIVSLTNNLIRCIVPDSGLTAGNLFIMTPNGSSNSVNYTIKSSTGNPIVVSNIPDQSMYTKESRLIARLENVFSDPNGDVLSYSASSSSALLQINLDSLKAGELFAASAGDNDETVTVVVTATDKTNVSVSDTFIINVKSPKIPIYSVSGTLRYDNNTPLSGLRIYLKDLSGRKDSILSNNSGDFNFSGKLKGTYFYEAKCSREWSGVTATDALKVLLHVVGRIPLEGLKLQAADVNKSGTVNSTDALFILRRIIGNISEFPAGDWIFALGDQITIDNSDVVRDINAIITGDVNASYNPSLAKSDQNINLIYSDKIAYKLNENIELPVFINTPSLLGAFSIELSYPINIFELTGVSSNYCDLIYSINNGIIRIAWSSLKTLKAEGKTELLRLIFRVKDNQDVAGIQPFELNRAESEFADDNGNTLKSIDLSIPSLEFFIPNKFSLKQNYPNPFNPSTIIEYELPEKGLVTLEVFNLLGERVCTLIDQMLDPGVYKAEWNGRAMQSGIYFYRIEIKGASNYTEYRKMILMK